jgi:SWI/SNF-related matrix-associated actin-dependent regulator of chromatin subfamily A member 5
MVCKMNEIGYGMWDELKIAIRQAWQFRFDWFIKSRTPLELQRRCETLTRLIEKEVEEMEAKKKAEQKVTASKKNPPAKGGAKSTTKKRPAAASTSGTKKKKK